MGSGSQGCLRDRSQVGLDRSSKDPGSLQGYPGKKGSINMYKVQKVEDGYQIFQVDGELMRPLDGEKVYPSRQNAYYRCKQLNEGRKARKMQEVKVKIEALRQDCKMLIKKIEEDFGDIEILVIDPFFPDDNHRFI